MDNGEIEAQSTEILFFIRDFQQTLLSQFKSIGNTGLLSQFNPIGNT